MRLSIIALVPACADDATGPATAGDEQALTASCAGNYKKVSELTLANGSGTDGAQVFDDDGRTDLVIASAPPPSRRAVPRQRASWS